jgi:hypothetical protein
MIDFMNAPGSFLRAKGHSWPKPEAVAMRDFVDMNFTVMWHDPKESLEDVRTFDPLGDVDPAVGIHFRCTDYAHALPGNGSRILAPSYYINCVEEIESRRQHAEDANHYIALGDDLEHPTPRAVMTWMRLCGLDVHAGKPDEFEVLLKSSLDQGDALVVSGGISKAALDFNLLMHCQTIISSNSSFCFWAAFLGHANSVFTPKRWTDIPGDNLSEFTRALPRAAKFEGEP